MHNVTRHSTLTAGRQNDFTKGKISGAIVQMALPMTLAQLVNILYNLVDRLFIGWMPEVGTDALTGLGVCFPITILVAAVSRLCGAGGAPLCSIERGKGDDERAEQILGSAMFMLILSGAVLTAVGQSLIEPMLYAFGASDETYVYAEPYCRIYLYGNIFVLISLGLNPYINAQGFSKVGMKTVCIGAAANLVLDPIFIYTLDMGVAGAAVATVISQAISAVWVIRFLTGEKAVLRIRRKNIRPRRGITLKSVEMGVTGFVMTGTNGLVAVTANKMLALCAGDIYVGVMTVITSVRELVFMPVQGITGGAEPVMGYNYGAKRYDRVADGIKFMFKVAVTFGTVAWAILMCVPEFMFMAFTRGDIELAAVGSLPFRIYFSCHFMMALMMSGQSTFVALGKPKFAITFSLLRKAIIVVPLMMILPRIPSVGKYGVFLAEPISCVIASMACFVVMCFTQWIPIRKKGLEIRAKMADSNGGVLDEADGA